MQVWRTVEQDENGPPPIKWHDPQIVAALLIARQLRDIVTNLEAIRAQLQQIEDSISNQ